MRERVYGIYVATKVVAVTVGLLLAYGLAGWIETGGN